jgi:hypothetical protein
MSSSKTTISRRALGPGPGTWRLLAWVARLGIGARAARARGVSDAVMTRSVAPSSGRHGREVSWVAASLELRGMRWLGPHGLRTEPGWQSGHADGTRHTPDLGLIHTDGRRSAIEVELHPKSTVRLAHILGGYRELIRTGSLDDVAYVSDRRDVIELIRREAERALVSEPLHIGQLAPIVETVRQRGRQARAQRLSG